MIYIISLKTAVDHRESIQQQFDVAVCEWKISLI
ncbi:glycosyltransferase family 25 protein [Aliivibrio finisterrensis]|nr:glycosyltransferase family 25 protein [Aliivibrio finisterrensis]